MSFIWVIWSETKKTNSWQCKEDTCNWFSHWRKECMLLGKVNSFKSCAFEFLFSVLVYLYHRVTLHNNIENKKIIILVIWWKLDIVKIFTDYLLILFVIEEEVEQRQLTLLSNFASSEARNCSTANETATSL